MRTCNGWPVSVCSWSFQQDIADVRQVMRDLDIEYVNLALLPALQEDGGKYAEFIAAQDWHISATMINFPCEDYSTLESIAKTGGIALDDAWEENKKLALDAIKLTSELKAEYLLMHFGFIDHKKPAYVKKFYDRTRVLADAAAENEVKFLMETGQETAEELEQFLEAMDHPALCLNFDPANMILYGKGVPVEAIQVLAPWVRHVHIKDALRTEKPGTWGTEVPWGEGNVNTKAFLRTLKALNYQGVVAIEREAGDDRLGDITMAAERLSKF